MTDLRTAAQQALDFIVATNKSSQFWLVPESNLNKTVTALKAALAEEALQRFTDVNQEIEAALAEPVQEPVAWLWQHRETGRTRVLMRDERTATDVAAAWDVVGPLYLAPPQRKPPATIDEMFDRMDKAPKGVFFGHDPMTIWMEAWRAAEQQQGIT